MKRTDLEDLFEEANMAFIRKNTTLFETQVSERTLCGALMIELHEVLKKSRYAKYYCCAHLGLTLYRFDCLSQN